MALSQGSSRRFAFLFAAIPALAVLLCQSPRALSGSCMDDCLRDCNSDGTTCRIECQFQCQPQPQTCEFGFNECFRTGLRPHCCPEGTNCCAFRDRATLQLRLNCCAPGEACCENLNGGCFDPSTRQCTAGGIQDCPSDRTLCFGVCCEVGETCSAAGRCCPPTGCVEPTCESDIQCADPSKVPEGIWPACFCQNDPPEEPDELPDGGSIVPGEGYHPGLGGVDNCNAMFVCPPRFKMDVGEGDVCVCK